MAYTRPVYTALGASAATGTITFTLTPPNSERKSLRIWSVGGSYLNGIATFTHIRAHISNHAAATEYTRLHSPITTGAAVPGRADWDFTNGLLFHQTSLAGPTYVVTVSTRTTGDTIAAVSNLYAFCTYSWE